MTITRINAAEEEYFRRQEADRRSDEARDHLQQTSRAHRAAPAPPVAAGLRSCPECKIALEKRTSRGIEHDHCSSCGGIWLEAGGLEKLSKKHRVFLAKLLATWRGRGEK